MPDKKEILGNAIENYLKGVVLSTYAKNQIPGINLKCVEGFVKGLVRLEGRVTFAGELIEPQSLTSASYLGDGTFNLRVDFPTADSACQELKTVIQGTLQITDEYEFDVPLWGRATIKVNVGPLSLHLRIFKCERRLGLLVPSAEQPEFAMAGVRPREDRNTPTLAGTGASRNRPNVRTSTKGGQCGC